MSSLEDLEIKPADPTSTDLVSLLKKIEVVEILVKENYLMIRKILDNYEYTKR